MCEALRELMEPEFSEERRKAAEQGWIEGCEEGRKEGMKEGIKEGIREGVKTGRIEGTIDTLKKIGRTMDEIVSYVMAEFNLSETEVKKYIK